MSASVSPADATSRRTGAIAGAYARVVVHGRHVVVLAWLAAAATATIWLPLGTQGATDESSLLPSDAPALRAELDSARLFGYPLISRTLVVQRDPNGLSADAQLRAVQRAVVIDQAQGQGQEPVAGAVPVTNALGLFPGSRERSTTIVTYLYFRPSVTFAEQATDAERFASEQINRPDDHLVGVTGSAVARARQESIVKRWLPFVEIFTILAIGLIVGLAFRSAVAPIAILGCAAIAYLIVIRVLGWGSERFDLSIPPDLEPVLVALLLGIVTDYCVFFLSGVRRLLGAGVPRVEAARRTTAQFAPIILTAGVIVAAGTASLLVARLGFLRAFGPGMAVTVLVALAVSISLMPALLAILGTRMYAPWGRRRLVVEAPRTVSPAPHGRTEWRLRVARFTTAKPVAAVIVLVAVAALVLGAWSLPRMRLGFSLITALPSDTEARQAELAATAGFVPGILSPTVIVLRHTDIGTDRQALTQVGAALRREPGVAGVLGPGDVLAAQQAVQAAGGPGQDMTADQVFLAKSGDAARYVLILDGDPLGASGIDQLKGVEQRLPSILRSAGLSGTTAEFAGDTALAEETVRRTLDDLWRIALAILVVDLVLLAIFLRALIAPLYLLAASVLALLATLGLTVVLFQDILGRGDITYYVPFAVAVLLISLGSDYNVFVVGRIWEEARVRPVREAIAIAAPRAARTITIAGMALAASFAILATVPLVQFREFAFAMAAGVVIDAFIVRSALVPAMVSLFGRLGGWPGSRLRTAQTPSAPDGPPPATRVPDAEPQAAPHSSPALRPADP